MSQARITVKRLIRSLLEPKVAYLILRNWIKMMQNRRLNPLYGSIFETLLTPGSNPYFKKLKEQNEDGLVFDDILDFQMYLDVDDHGLSRTLLQFGIREEISTNAFRNELEQLKDDIEGEITVLEIGANIGYYTLLEATVLGDRCNIYAIEPVPRNIEILEKNVALNGFSDNISLHQLALGDQNKRAELHLAEESNWHSFHRIKDHSSSIEVNVMTADRFLSEQNLSPDSVHVVRTDPEGFEVEIFQAMDQILASETPLLVFVELHPSFRDASELNQIIDNLNKHNFEIVSTTLDVYGGRFDQGWSGKPVEFDSFNQIKEHHENSDAAVELIARKG